MTIRAGTNMEDTEARENGAHTPTPWELSGTAIWGVSQFNARVRLAEVAAHSPLNGIDWQANAAFIVRACNSHEQLVDALRQCSNLFSAIRGDWTDPRSECREGQEIISAALAAAEAA